MSNEAARLITIAICTRNRSDFLAKAVRSVVPQLTPDTELLVVDNASTDDTRRVCEQLAGETRAVTYLCEPKLGLSSARNTAINRANGKYVLFLDDDALAEPGWLAAYCRFLSQPPAEKIAVVGGMVIPYYARPWPPEITADPVRFDLGEETRRLGNGGLSGCNSAYCREATKSVGLFDERLGYKGKSLIPREETELQERLAAAGWECWWLTGAAVRHHVAVQRESLKGHAMASFNAGRAAAIHRLKTATLARQRLALRLGRLIISPVHMLINLVPAGILFLLGRQKAAVGACCRAARAAGWAWQMLHPLGQ